MNHVVVYNLLETDLTEERVEKIEEAIKSAAKELKELMVNPANLSFSFLHDPTVTSGKIPIIIVVELLFDSVDLSTFALRQHLAVKVWLKFRKTVQEWRSVSEVKVAVKRFSRETDGYITG